MRAKVVLLGVMFALAVGVVSGFAQGPGKGQMGMKGHKECKAGLMGIPDLTTDQISKIQKLKLEHQKEMLPMKTKLQVKRLELRSIILENGDRKKVDAKVEEIGKALTESLKKKVAHRLAVRNLLTDDQKVYFDAKGFGCHGKRGEGFGGRHGHNCGAGFEKHPKLHR